MLGGPLCVHCLENRETNNLWLSENDFLLGRPTAKALISHWQYASYALSQALVRDGDLKRFAGLFEAYDLVPGNPVPEAEMTLLVHDWMTSHDSSGPSEQLRIVQYASCRGLEGWTVVLDGFDDFLESIAARKRGPGLHQGEVDGFVDLETASYREAWRWGMIALTRPIDTLVIQLKDSGNRFARQVLEIARKLEDFAEVIL